MIHNDEIRSLVRTAYSPADVNDIRRLLDRHGVLHLPALPSGLYSAALATPDTSHTGYMNVWVRDNVHIANAEWADGRPGVAAVTARSLAAHFGRQRERFEAIIKKRDLAADVMNRPHVRFDGAALGDLDDNWSHAQNDALGYFLWLFCALARDGHIDVGQREAEVLAEFPRYFEAIRYWQDEDSGHWEEGRKISASSIGAVVAGLRELKRLVASRASGDTLRSRVPLSLIDELLVEGRTHLSAILPFECVQPDRQKNRRYDAALLFLIYPLEVVDAVTADRILANVATYLEGEYGIARYPGDSFWSANYWTNFTAADRTRNVSDDLTPRDRFFIPGTEAQWCIFDPIMSVVYGRRFQQARRSEDLARQIHYLNRSLGQITGAGARCGVGPGQVNLGPFKCPELYHLETVESGKTEVQPSEATPLLWTQANLQIALRAMEESL